MGKQERLQKDADKISESDLGKVLARGPRLLDLASHQARLRPFLDDIKTGYSLLKDYVNGSYRTIPWGSIAFIAAALLYVLNPLDMIPDITPLAGFIDDAGILALCWKLVQGDLDKYRAYKGEISSVDKSDE